MSEHDHHEHHNHHEHLDPNHEHHHHGHHHHGHHHHADLKNLGIAFFLNIAFVIIEIAGGFWTNSVAILSDALHDFGDSLTIAFAWGLQQLSVKGRDKNYSYGYKRFSVLGAIITSIVLVIGSVFIIISAVQRLQAPQEVHGLGMLLLACLGVIVNGVVMLRLRDSKSINTRAIMLHHLEDVMGWVAVLVGSLGIWLFGWHFLDPLLSIAIAAYILFNVFKNLRFSLKIFLQAIPSGIKIDKLIQAIQAHEMVVDVHDVHIWSLDGELNILTAHIVIADEKTSIEALLPLKKELETLLKQFGIEHSTLAFETVNDDCGLTEC
jgi:cobalt-zinc-cadmium efflux system protein